MKLCKSYRSTYEITNFAQKIQINNELSPVMRHGEYPTILRFNTPKDEISGILELISTFQKSGYTSLGIICKTETLTQKLVTVLQTETNHINFLSSQSSVFTKGIIITSAHIAKGLEFDEVIIPQVNDENYHSIIDKSMLYVAVTRAMHKLTLTYCNKQSELIP